MHGGAEWTGASFDPVHQRLYVSANKLPWVVTIAKSAIAARPRFGQSQGANNKTLMNDPPVKERAIRVLMLADARGSGESGFAPKVAA